MARMLVTNDESRRALRGLSQMLVGGEALSAALATDLAQATDATLHNMYGPTETTIWSTTGPATDPGIGRAIANTRLYVLDDARAPVPTGAEGELWIGGAGVARGYLHRDDLTSERFVPDPFAGDGRIYRTGDLVRWRPDGTLDYIGRADGQVKLRGHRIELGEVEAALDAAPGVTAGVALLRQDTPGLQQLVAYVTGTADPAALRDTLAARLPPQMVPARIVPLDRFPLTPNGKIDRNALPRPGMSEPPDPTPAPTGAAQTIAEIWKRLLGIETVTRRDNFFDLGGHSLLAVQAHRDITAALGDTTLGITDIFRFPTLGALADRVGGPPAKPVPPSDDRATARTDAMARRRALRAARR